MGGSSFCIPPPEGEGGRARSARPGGGSSQILSEYRAVRTPPGSLRSPPSPFRGGINSHRLKASVQRHLDKHEGSSETGDGRACETSTRAPDGNRAHISHPSCPALCRASTSWRFQTK